MRPEVVGPTLDEHGYEEHPAWAMIGASRVQSGPPGAVLFDSDVRHQHYVTVKLAKAKRRRDLNHDHLHGTQEVVEVAMSEAQWASFVSSMNVGSGVPCTVLYMPGDDGKRQMIPDMPYAPRLQESMAEVHGAANKSLETIREAFALVKEKPNKGNIRHLEIVLQNAAPNMEFAATSLNKHAENVVQRARADLEAMVVAKADQLGLGAGDLGLVPQLARPEREETS